MDINWTLIITALISSIPSAIIAWRTGKRVDGRMEELLKVTRSDSKAAGKSEELAEQRSRNVAKAKARKS